MLSLLIPFFALLLLVGAVIFFFLWRYERRRALRDELTGLANYRAFLNKAQQYQRIGSGMGIALTDMNDFRRYNEKGYLHGDLILKSFAQQLQSATAGYAFCARYRLGDEFVVLFKSNDFDIVSEQLRSLCKPDLDTHRLLFSYGISSFSDPALTIEQMLDKVHGLLLVNKGEVDAG